MQSLSFQGETGLLWSAVIYNNTIVVTVQWMNKRFACLFDSTGFHTEIMKCWEKYILPGEFHNDKTEKDLTECDVIMRSVYSALCSIV